MIARNCHVHLCFLLPKSLHDKGGGLCTISNDDLITGHQEYGLVPLARDRNISSMYFTILRHPLTRIPSLYHYIQKSIGHRLYQDIKNITLIEFVKKYDEASNRMTMLICGVSKNNECRKNPKYALKLAINHIMNDFAVVGLQECFNESLYQIENIMPWIKQITNNNGNDGIKFKGGFKRNVNINKPQSHSLTLEEIDIIIKNNILDIELYSVGLKLFKQFQQYQESNWIMSKKHADIIDCENEEQKLIYNNQKHFEKNYEKTEKLTKKYSKQKVNLQKRQQMKLIKQHIKNERALERRFEE